MSIMDIDGDTPITEKYLVDNGWKKDNFQDIFKKVIQCKYIPKIIKEKIPQ